MQTHVFILVPCNVPPTEICEFVRLLLERSRLNEDEVSGRWDYRYGSLPGTLNDPVTEARLPLDVRRSLSGNICDACRLPSDAVPGALVTLDGAWHELGDFGWRMVDEPCEANDIAMRKWAARFHELVSEHEHCWVVEAWVHS